MLLILSQLLRIKRHPLHFHPLNCCTTKMNVISFCWRCVGVVEREFQFFRQIPMGHWIPRRDRWTFRLLLWKIANGNDRWTCQQTTLNAIFREYCGRGRNWSRNWCFCGNFPCQRRKLWFLSWLWGISIRKCLSSRD